MRSRLLDTTPVFGLVLGLCLALSACSSAMKVERAKGLGATKYKHLIVAVGINDVEMRKYAEEAFAEERAGPADVVPSSSVLELTRGYEDDEVERAFRAANADAVAIITPNGAGREKVVYATNMGTNGRGTRGRVCAFGTKLGCIYWATVYDKWEDPRPWVNFRVELYEMKTGRMMWAADVRTTGRPNESTRAILRRLATDVVASWQKDGVLSRPTTTASR
jgi:hypothetical protein